MPKLPRRAVDRLLAVAAVASALIGGSTAHAQDDPFALPKSATATTAVAQSAAAGPGLSEIEIDGRLRARLVDLQGSGNTLTIDADHARTAGLPVPPEAAGPVRIDTLGLYQWRFDTLRQRLIVKLLRKSDGANLRDFAARDDVASERRTIGALRVDYDLGVSMGRGGIYGGGVASASFVKDHLAIVNSVQLASASQGKPLQARRLDSFVQLRLGQRGSVVTAGDFVSVGSASQRPVRMGGLQFASDFRNRPDMVTSPMPAFTGNVAVPTSLDILAGDQTYKLGQLEPGEFTVRNIPINPGRGAVSVLLRDSLGREVVRNVSFYQSSLLLAPGLSSYAINAGMVRRRYAADNDNYGPVAASAFYRRGLSSFLTIEGSGEWSAHVGNLGARADFTVGNLALSSIELRASRTSQGAGGALINATFESLGQAFSVRAGLSLPTSGYRDVASLLGDSPPRSQVFANVGFDLDKNIPVQVSYARIAPARDPRNNQEAIRNELLTGNLFYAPSPRFNISVNGGMRRAEQRSLFLSAALTLRFGPNHSASAAVTHNQGQSGVALGYQFNDYANSGVRVQASLGTVDGANRFNASAIQEGRFTTLSGGVVAYGKQVAGQLSATGSLIATGGTVFARGQSEQGYALVRAGEVAGIPIRLENRFVGTTDRHGRLLIANLRPMAPQQIDVDGGRIPLDAVVLTSRHTITIPARSVGLIEIDALYFRPAVTKVVDEKGEALAAGLPVTAKPSGRETLVGFDGIVEHNSASGDRMLIIKRPDAPCRVDVPDPLPDAGAPLVCRSLPTLAEGGQNAVKVARRD